jgi:catalase
MPTVSQDTVYRTLWDFWTSLPEALHQVTITMSNRGIFFSYRHMDGFGSHTCSMINAKGVAKALGIAMSDVPK